MKRLILFLLLATILVTGQADAATFATQIARVREYLYQTDSSNSIYTDEQITEAINEGMVLLENILSYSARPDNICVDNMSFDTGSVTLYYGTSSVFLPPLFGKIIALYDSTGKPYIQIKPEEAFRTRTATTKDPVFIMLNGIFYIYPAPTTSGTLKMIYSKIYYISPIDGSLTVEFKHLNKLTLAAVWYILQADNQTARAGNIYKLLTDLVTIENNALVNTNVIERVQGGK